MDDDVYVRAEDVAHPVDVANAASVATLAWMDPLIRKGAVQPLQEADVWPLRTADAAAAMHSRFVRHWTTERTKATPRLACALWCTFRTEIVVTSLLYACSAALTLVQPWLIKSIVQYLEHKDEDGPLKTSMGITSGYGLAGLLASASFLAVMTGDYAQAMAARIGCNVKSIFVDAVFLKTLTLSGNAKATLTSGDVVTMTTVDSEKMLLGFWMGFWALIAPAMLLVIMILM
ncbi:ATP-binding Cassette (ABC) Superfamily, partial [Achlya hypogyna]